MADNYIKKINGLPVAASEAAPGSPLATKLATLVSGAFEVVNLNQSGKPNVANPSTKIIYLTKSSTAGLTDPYTEWIYTGTDGEAAVASKWEIIGETSIDLSGYKTKQTAYTASGLGTLKTITALTQNANGEISVTASDIQSASTSQKGVVQLAGSIGSSVATENNKAATEKAVSDALATKADAASVVTEIAYDTANKAIVARVDGAWTTAIEAGDLPYVRYDVPSQSLNPDEQANARYNIGAGTSNLTLGPTADDAAAGNHTHGNITNDGKVGTTADYSVVTTTGGAITAKSLATSSPTASGTTLSFIDTVSQASDGKITATKKTVSTMGGANGSAAGTAGLVPAPGAADNTKYLRGDGTWATPPAANNGALKLQINGGTATSKFTANQSGDSTITFATGTTNGTIKVDGTEVAVAGLGSAAYTASTAYATSAQGTKADSAIQGVKVNNTALTPDSGKIVNIPLAATNSSGSAGTAGAVTLEIVSI